MFGQVFIVEMLEYIELRMEGMGVSDEGLFV